MASTFSELGIELMATGENAGTWGTKTNANLNLVEQITGGYVEQSIAGGAQTTNLLVADGALTGKAQNRIIKLTGSITGNQVVTLPVNMENFYIINNATTDGSGTPTVQIKAISGSGATVTWAAGEKGFKILYSDGVATNTGVFDTGFSTSTGDVTLTGTQTLTNKTLTAPKIGTSILDTSGNELFKLTATSSAVNELTYANAATGNSPTFTASGNDTNIGVSIQPKGSGAVKLDLLTFPTVTGGANQIMTSNGSGVLSFVDNSGGTNWQSSIVTASTLTAAAGNGYWINTTSNICTITLPGSPSVGDTIILVDYARTWGTNKITFNLNSLKFQGNTTPLPVYDTDGQSVTIVYSGATKGWIPTVDDDVTLETPQSYTITYLVVGGGGAGGSDSNGSNNSSGGGGGAGGLRSGSVTLDPGVTMTAVVGGGGNGNVAGNGSSGTASSLAATGLTTVTSAGGGGGGAEANNGINGGSGGGGGMGNDGPTGSYGNGNTPSVSPSQGNNGGAAESPNSSTASSGGGGGAGESGNTDGNGFGGDGTQSSIIGSATFYAGGGAGGTATSGSAKPGGDGGGGAGTTSSGGANPGTNALGGGGGGAGESAPNIKAGGTGGDGVVILSVPIGNYSTTTSGSPTVSESGGNKIIKFTGNGTYTT